MQVGGGVERGAKVFAVDALGGGGGEVVGNHVTDLPGEAGVDEGAELGAFGFCEGCQGGLFEGGCGFYGFLEGLQLALELCSSSLLSAKKRVFTGGRLLVS